ncbi:MAG TPA: AraC family transcriptional regulator [Bacillota bacterium]|nr:AraC family transcriptional regulator [Bacillota bacterium]
MEASIKTALPEPLLVEYRQINQPFTMPLNHYHEAYEIYYLLSGERYYFITDKTYHVIPGDLVLIGLNELHKTSQVETSSHERILINFTPEAIPCHLSEGEDLLACFSGPNNVLRLDIAERNKIEEILFKMIHEKNNRAYGYQTYIKTLVVQLLILINRHKNQKTAPELRHASYEKIYDILRFINQHYRDDITLDVLSKSFFISPYHLSRTFKKVTGFSFIEYLNSIRTKEAQRLIRETSQSISHIAASVGFDSLTHFGRVFKSITGLSPSQYRKKSNC